MRPPASRWPQRRGRCAPKHRNGTQRRLPAVSLVVGPIARTRIGKRMCTAGPATPSRYAGHARTTRQNERRALFSWCLVLPIISRREPMAPPSWWAGHVVRSALHYTLQLATHYCTHCCTPSKHPPLNICCNCAPPCLQTRYADLTCRHCEHASRCSTLVPSQSSSAPNANTFPVPAVRDLSQIVNASTALRRRPSPPPPICHRFLPSPWS
jgi:hypothetical protein